MKQYPGYNHQTQYDMMAEASHYHDIYPYCNGRKVLDIGANIGSFAYNVLKAGCSKVVCIEASNRNHTFLQEQPFIKRFVEQDRVKVVHAAVVRDDYQRDYVQFYEGSGKDTSIDSTVFRRGRGNGYKVRTLKFLKLIESVKPQILKVDIEGGERSFDWEGIPDTVEAMAIELHVDGPAHERWADRTRDLLMKRWPVLLREYDTYRFKKYVTKEIVLAKTILDESYR